MTAAFRRQLGQNKNASGTIHSHLTGKILRLCGLAVIDLMIIMQVVITFNPKKKEYGY